MLACKITAPRGSENLCHVSYEKQNACWSRHVAFQNTLPLCLFLLMMLGGYPQGITGKMKKNCQCFMQGNALLQGCYTTRKRVVLTNDPKIPTQIAKSNRGKSSSRFSLTLGKWHLSFFTCWPGFTLSASSCSSTWVVGICEDQNAPHSMLYTYMYVTHPRLIIETWMDYHSGHVIIIIILGNKQTKHPKKLNSI